MVNKDVQITMTRDGQGKPVGMKFKGFRVKTTVDAYGHEEKQLEFHKHDLIEWLRNNLNLEDMYNTTPVVGVYELFNQLDNIKYRAKRHSSTIPNELINFLEDENKDILIKLKNLTAKGQMSFGLCKTLFAPGAAIEIHDAETFGARVIAADYKSSMWGNYLQIVYEFISSNGKNLVHRRDQVRIGSFTGVKEISRLPIRPLNDETKAKLTQRGKMYVDIATGAKYMQYQGQMLVKKWWSWDSMRADGRMMADIGTYSQFVDEYNSVDDDDDSVISEVTDDILWMTDPYVKGFSFSAKQWGKFAVSRISDIQFKDDAFTQLVLAEDKKELIRALVTNGTSGFSDIISGKGGGCIFLLHGEPGVGKTLTAEAIAELLHRPLYSVSVGELGTDTTTLENSLRQILDVAQIWNAVILIDEADIFLEKRGHDIVRSALTSVFLRLTEYHQGVMFLTTNRVETFDPAFYSRISIALKYGSLTEEARTSIWSNLLSAADISGLDPRELAKININGRQIKNTIRLAQGLAAQANVPVNMQHVMQVVEISRQFLDDVHGY